MRKTYAYNSIIFGILIGILVYAATQNVALTVLAGIGVSVVGFVIIRAIENLLYKGAEKASEKIGDAIQRRKDEKEAQNGYFAPTTRMPERTRFPASESGTAESFCPYCGASVAAGAGFCPACGGRLKKED